MRDEDLTAAERDAFASLPRTAPASDLLEERTVRTLAAHGLLHATGRHRHRRFATWMGAAAACVTFFVAGFVLGQKRDGRDATPFAGTPHDSLHAATTPAPGTPTAWQVAAAESTTADQTRYVVWF